jgi:hypothetical protein
MRRKDRAVVFAVSDNVRILDLAVGRRRRPLRRCACKQRGLRSSTRSCRSSEFARDYGFGDEQRLRGAFLRLSGSLDYRGRFSGAAIPRAAPEGWAVTIASYQI